MGVTLSGEIQEYIERLRRTSNPCERPMPDGRKCVQCREREEIADKLEEILRNHGLAATALARARERISAG